MKKFIIFLFTFLYIVSIYIVSIGLFTNNIVNFDFSYNYSNDKIEKISTHSTHTLALSENSEIFSWGNNNAMGDVNQGVVDKPTNITNNGEFINLNEDEYVVDISAGSTHSLAVTNYGNVYAWGSNNDGELGMGKVKPGEDTNFVRQDTPIKINTNFNGENNFPDIDNNVGEKIIRVEAGDDSSYALTNFGQIYAWGNNEQNQLAIDGPVKIYTPVNITNIDGYFDEVVDDDKVIDLSTSNEHVLALTENGLLYAWGLNDEGQIGNGDGGKDEEGIRKTVIIPENISNYGDLYSLNPNEKINNISAGSFHSGLVTNEGNIFTWGYNSNGQLGNDNIDDLVYSPTNINDQGDFSEIDANDKINNIFLSIHHSGAITNDGKVFTWGDSSYGRLGDEVIVGNAKTPIMINETHNGENNFPDLNPDNNEKIINLILGREFTFAISNEGQVYSWGKNDKGQLGIKEHGDPDEDAASVKLTPQNITNNFTFNARNESNNLTTWEIIGITLGTIFILIIIFFIFYFFYCKKINNLSFNNKISYK